MAKALAVRVRFPSRNFEAASCPSFSIFDGSQDWVIVHHDVVAGSSPGSGTKCRSSSVVEHVFPVRFFSVVTICGGYDTLRGRSQPAGANPMRKNAKLEITVASRISE